MYKLTVYVAKRTYSHSRISELPYFTQNIGTSYLHPTRSRLSLSRLCLSRINFYRKVKSGPRFNMNIYYR